MTKLRMDHVSVVVDDLDAAVAFFTALGLEPAGRARVEGDWVDRVNAIDGVSVDITMMQTPDGHGRLELTKFRSPQVIGAGTPAPPNAFGLRSVMFEVDDIEAMVATLADHGATLVGEIARYEDLYLIAYVRGPADIIVALAESIS